MSNYQIGDLIEATIIENGKPVRDRFAYVPDGEDDLLPFRRLLPTADPREQWFDLGEMTDEKRLVLVVVEDGER